MAFAELIPGLPNDLAIQCLLCLSSEELLRARAVSSLWKIAIASDRFYVERRLRAPFPSICVIQRIDSSYQIFDIDAVDLENRRLLFSCDLQTGQMLFPPGVVFATMGPSILAFAPGMQVQKFSLLTRRWIPVSKTMPPERKLFATALGKYIIVLACKQNVDGHDHDHDHTYGRHGHDVDDGFLRRTMCAVFDAENNEWASLEGLPDDFVGTHCVTCQGIVYARGKANDLSVSVYALDLSKKRWVANVHMGDHMQFVLHESKVVVKSDAILMASLHSNDTMSFQRQRAGAIDWMDVVKVNAKPSSNFFIFEQGDKIFLVILYPGASWRSRTVVHYHGLTILHIPGDDLLLAGSIFGEAQHDE